MERRLATQQRGVDALWASFAVVLEEPLQLTEEVRQGRETVEQVADAVHQGPQLPLHAMNCGGTDGRAHRDAAAATLKRFA